MKRTAKVVERDNITLDAVDKSGRSRRVRLTATIVSPDRLITKALPEPSGPGASADDAASRSNEDELESLIKGQGIVRPPYNLYTLSMMHEQSTELGQAIRAMVTNTVGFHWQLRERPMPDEIRQQHAKEIELEKFQLMARLHAVHPTSSLTDIREQELWDKHACGQGYIELIENRRGDLIGLSHVRAYGLMVTVKDKVATRIDVPLVRPELGFKLEERSMAHRFRRFVQIRNYKGGAIEPVWFKEAGDPRQMDYRTGQFGDNIPFKYRATSLIKNAHYNPASPYGVPLWIGNLFSVMGSRAAEEINYNTLSSNAVPSMMVIVENGALTDASIARMKEWTEEHVQKSQNYSTFLIIEGEALEEGSPDTGNFKIRVEPLKRLQQQDELFQQYDSNNKDKVRQAFRLPPIFVGRAEDYNRATADTSRDIADEQIFAPERARADWLINRFVLSRWGARFHTFRSNHPNITDDAELIRMMGIGEKSGAVTPRIATRIMRDVFGDDLGPLPKGIDLDTPYSLQFAQAQGGGAGGGFGGSPAPGQQKGLIKDLNALYKAVEDELDSRFLLDSKDEE